ncbi:hypothetical protein GWI33_012143 [Rhynchophorus ferrugineus]|uniref:Tantalus-like domain-containing protein n=1 Tax=Rhynchophorus ferrugineus TaxID=354439 RepID=A0A834IJC6_RHYFE|nr:hypothetical protein GWI33_012143 [Rhynchophorus ferrugineus]
MSIISCYLSYCQEKDKNRPYNEVSTTSNSSSKDLNTETPVKLVRRSERNKHKSLETRDNRRVVKKPRKLSVKMRCLEDNFNVENYYLDKKIKLHSPALETIFEDPKENKFMSARKLRRCINFANLIKDKSKIKKRSMKAKELKKVAVIRKRIGMDYLLKKLALVEDNDNIFDNKISIIN